MSFRMRSVQLRDFTSRIVTWNPARDAPKSEIDYVDIGAIDQNLKTIVCKPKIPASTAPSRARQIVKTDDVLVSTVRPNLNSVARVPGHLDGATASTGFCVLRPKTERLDSSYLFHWVKAPSFVNDMTKKATGQSYPAVSDRIVLDSLIPLPPLDEQRRIAAILDAADSLRAKRSAALAKLDQLRNEIFWDVFASHLSVAPINVSLHDLTAPEGWRWALLTDVARLATGHTPDRKRPEYWANDVPWITLGDIRSLDGKLAYGTRESISELGLENSSAVAVFRSHTS